MKILTAGVLMIAFFSLMVSAAKSEDKNLKNTFPSPDTGCGRTDSQNYGSNFYMPIQLVWANMKEGEETVDYFKGKSFDDIMFMYQKAIIANLKAASEGNLDCAFGLITTLENIVSRSSADTFMDIQKGNNPGTLEGLAAIKEIWSNAICNDYNEIALQYKRNGKTEKSEDIYRYIMRHFDKDRYAACFKEAEISLQGLIK